MAEPARVRHLVLGLGAPDAAAAIGISATKFRELVADGRMPRPRRRHGAQWRSVMTTGLWPAVHFEIAADLVACGTRPFWRPTKDLALVTCEGCKRTAAYRLAADTAREREGG